MPSRKRTTRAVEVEEIDEPVPAKKGRGQPMLKLQDMERIITKYYNIPNTSWSKEEKQEIAEFMYNRAGIDISPRNNPTGRHLRKEFEYFFSQYVNLYENDKEFEAMIDPWQVIVIDKPNDNERYLAVLNRANLHINGNGDANEPGEPIQFQHGKDWILHIPGGREDARRVASYMAGELHDTEFSVIVQDYRASLRDA